MSSNEFYFKVKPKTNALVKAVASINLPLFSNDGAQYYAGLSIPDTGATSRQIEIDGVQISEGDPQYLSTTTVTTAGNNTISSPFNPLNNKYGFSTPEEFFAYRYGQEQPIQVNDGTDDAVSFQSIYCEWDRNKFANFVLESLVG